jgi:hypothetical protein
MQIETNENQQPTATQLGGRENLIEDFLNAAEKNEREREADIAAHPDKYVGLLRRCGFSITATRDDNAPAETLLDGVVKPEDAEEIEEIEPSIEDAITESDYEDDYYEDDYDDEYLYGPEIYYDPFWDEPKCWEPPAEPISSVEMKPRRLFLLRELE